ncbi:MAG: T9SS type A sorting domain-containing protein [Saprospiraceae bacterium]
MQKLAHKGFFAFPKPVYLPAIAFALWFSLWPGLFSNHSLSSPEPELAAHPMEAVQFALPGNFMAPFTNLNNIPEGGTDLNADGVIDIIPACSCRSLPIIPNGSNPNNGFFNDQLIIATGVSGQQWRVVDSDNVFLRASLLSVPQGTNIPEIGATGVYVLQTAVRDANASYALVESPDLPGLVFGPVTNTCYYPDPLIENLGSFYCDNAPDVFMQGSATSDFDGNVVNLDPANQFWSITRVQNNQTFFTQTFSPSTLGQGTYKVRYTFDVGVPAHGAYHQTGCATTVEKQVIVRSTASLACNSTINVTLNPTTCFIPVTPAMLLAGTPITYDFYTVEVFNEAGQNLGDTITAEYAGQTLLGVIQDDCSELFCITNINVKDFTLPTLTTPPNMTIPCTAPWQPEATGFAIATDCTPVELTYTDVWSETPCGNPKVQIFRTWRAVDAVGNVRTRIQTISIARGTQAALRFPQDRTFTCEAYQANPGIVNATAGQAGIPNLVDNPLCGMAYSFMDQRINLCGNTDVSFTIRRTWFVIDACTNAIYSTDGLGADNIQFIVVRDVTPPTIVAPPLVISATVSPQINGLGYCTGAGLIPAPIVDDPCNAFTIRIFTPMGEATYVNGVNGNDGGILPFPGLPLGVHEILYEATDACGNTNEVAGTLEIADDQTPFMLCDNAVSFSLSSGGFARLYPTHIDEGSFDDCCIDAFKLKFVDEPDSLFRDSIDFFCTNTTVEVVLRLYDCYGNFNECNSLVTVEDRVPPQVVQPAPNRTISCTSDFAPYLTAGFDAPQFADNCSFDVQFSVVQNLGPCNAGAITRTWTATDNPGNTPAVATQVITLSSDHDYRFMTPGDLTVSCLDNNFPAFTVTTEGCDSITVAVSETIEESTGGPECYRIIRTHTLINWCEYDGVSPAFQIPRGPFFFPAGTPYELFSDGEMLFRVTTGGAAVAIGPSTGRYTYQQIIRVTDDQAPQINVPISSQSVCAAATGSCTGAVNFDFSINDDCPGSLTVFHSLRLNNQPPQSDMFGVLSALGDSFYRISGQYPEGEHAFLVNVSDACGNISLDTLYFEVQDCTPPTLACTGNLVFELDAENELTLAPGDLLEALSDNCSEAALSFSPDGSLNSVAYNCDSIGLQQLTLWASDDAGNLSSCTVEFVIDAPNNTCVPTWRIQGNIRTEAGAGIGQAQVSLNGPYNDSLITQSNGVYAFTDVPSGMGYKVEPGKNIAHPNGISTVDVILISRHITFTQLLNSPYKAIAADANRSGNVSTLDIILLRKIILSIDTAFSNNTSWRFVPEDFAFTDPNNPFGQNFPESVLIQELSSDTTINFVGIKIGDVNNNANPAAFQNIEPRSSESLRFSAANAQLEPGEVYTLQLEGARSDALGFQCLLRFDADLLEFLEIAPTASMNDANFGTSEAEQGRIRVSWNQLSPGTAPTAALQFRAKASTNWQSALRILPEGLNPESYFLNGQGEVAVGSVALDFEEKQAPEASLTLLGCTPNPFNSAGDIRFRTGGEAGVSLKVFDVAGRLVTQQQAVYPEGLHHFRIENQDLPGAGLYFYEISNGEIRATGRLVLSGR